MIPRLLVPEKLSPVPADAGPAKPRRVSTLLDERTVIPATLPVVQLDGRSTIPAHVPLEVLGERILIPREAMAGTLELPQDAAYVPSSDLDERFAIPLDAKPAQLVADQPIRVEELEDFLEPDVLTTGKVNLLPKPVAEGPKKWSWVSTFGSVGVHVAFVAIIILGSTLFTRHTPTEAEIELAKRQLGIVYLPNSVFNIPEAPPKPPEPPSEKMRIDPKLLRQVAPPEVEPSPNPGPPNLPEPPRVARELPSAPTPAPPEQGTEVPRKTARLEPVKPLPDAPSGLVLPRVSPGKALEEAQRGAMKRGGSNSGSFEGPVPRLPGGGGDAGGGGGEGYLGGNVEMLTPTEGVDFSNYLARVLASVRRNWYAVIPTSARLGEKGRVVLQFRIMRDGQVPDPEPVLVGTSGREPLDRAAMSSITASNPFPPLPTAFSGPYIELRFTFLYNLPLDYR